MAKKTDIVKHALIPKHVKISDKEKSDLMSKYDIEESNLPKILKTDSAIASLSAKPGDVIKITRKSLTAGEAVFYRVVVDA